ncbi:cdf-like metal transporter [Moniliophthora roreri]|nr:cdf-like metal transporter [Moniliophthora roreri]
MEGREIFKFRASLSPKATQSIGIRTQNRIQYLHMDHTTSSTIELLKTANYFYLKTTSP